MTKTENKTELLEFIELSIKRLSLRLHKAVSPAPIPSQQLNNLRTVSLCLCIYDVQV